MSKEIEIESYLQRGFIRGMDINKKQENMYIKNIYNFNDRKCEESRTIYPAWKLRDLEQNRWIEHNYKGYNTYIDNKNLFHLQTRNIERDHFVPSYPKINM